MRNLCLDVRLLRFDPPLWLTAMLIVTPTHIQRESFCTWQLELSAERFVDFTFPFVQLWSSALSH